MCVEHSLTESCTKWDTKVDRLNVRVGDMNAEKDLLQLVPVKAQGKCRLLWEALEILGTPAINGKH